MHKRVLCLHQIKSQHNTKYSHPFMCACSPPRGDWKYKYKLLFWCDHTNMAACVVFFLFNILTLGRLSALTHTQINSALKLPVKSSFPEEFDFYLRKKKGGAWRKLYKRYQHLGYLNFVKLSVTINTELGNLQYFPPNRNYGEDGL